MLIHIHIHLIDIGVFRQPHIVIGADQATKTQWEGPPPLSRGILLLPRCGGDGGVRPSPLDAFSIPRPG